MLIAIWAQDKNGLIGKENVLPWHLPNDLKFFKEKTLGNVMVMGRKTFEGMGGRPLPKRQTIVLTKNTAYQPENVEVLHSVEAVLAFAKEHPEPVFITGGSTIYQELLPYCDKLYRTVIDYEFDGDAYFPKVDWQQWNLIDSVEGVLDEKNIYPHRFETYLRK